jgi:hypothetical protein
MPGDRIGKRAAGQAGFTVAELTVSLLVTIEVLLGVLLLFDFSSRVSRVQTNVAEMQQSLRSAEQELERFVRMAGRGGLPAGNALPARSVWVQNNVAPNTTIGGLGTPEVAAGTDVLTVRGAFASPIYQINTLTAGSYQLWDGAGDPTTDPAAAVRGQLLIQDPSPVGVPQPLQALADAVARGIAEPLILVNGRSPGVYAVVELDLDPVVTNPAAGLFGFRIFGGGGPDDHTAAYRALSPGGVFPAAMNVVSFVGILEEYRYYVRSGAVPGLARARVFPGTDAPYGPGPAGDPARWQEDVADNVLDLQAALGIDTMNQVPNPGRPGAGPSLALDPVGAYISEAADGRNDDWLFNSADDDPAVAVWANAKLYYVRLNLLARTARRDLGYQAPPVGRIEDRTYAPADPVNADVAERQRRRRILQTVVNVRNL